MSAGSGLMHSEMNRGHEPVHLYQIWIEPRERGIAPRHDERDFSEMPHDTLVPIASGFDHDALTIHTDAVIYRGIFDTQTTLTHTPHSMAKNIFLYVTHGTVIFADGEKIQTGDQARITDMEKLEMTFAAGTDVVVIEVGD